jgi:hypothetical protein
VAGYLRDHVAPLLVGRDPHRRYARMARTSRSAYPTRT